MTFAATVAVISATAGPAAGVAPVPTITDAPDGTRGFPLNSSALDLGSLGYVEEEYFIEGTARSYEPVAPLADSTDGRWDATPTGPTAPYRVRVLVRRPADEAAFNGTVVTEWLNVTAGAPGQPDWTYTSDELLRGGYAWVGVSAQYVGVAYELTWETGPGARYATLNHPGDSYSYDIYSQAGQALVSPGPAGPAPLGPLTDDVQALIADGESQSANRLFTYVNAVHGEAQVYDGFLIHSAIGAAAPLTQANLAGPATPASGLPLVSAPTGPALVIRNDVPEPILVVNTETDIVRTPGGGLHSQPDTASFRLWELTGTAHADTYLLTAGAADAAKSGSTFTLECGQPPINDGPHTYGMRAGIRALSAWVQDGAAPPIADRITTTGTTIVRDPSTGIALGGVRLPAVEAPTRTLTGERPPGALVGNPFCVLFGATDEWNGDSDTYDGSYGPPVADNLDPSPTPEPDLATLYPTTAEYVAQVVRAAKASVRDGFLLDEDAGEIVLDAAGLFTPVTPTRIADTRDGTGGIDATRLEPGQVLRVRAADTSDVPSGVAAALALNVTAAAPSADGYLTVHPCLDPAPGTSNVNFLAGQIAEPNAVITAVGADDEVCISTFAETDVVVDVTGWFAPDGGFVPLAAPARVADSRDGVGQALARVEPGDVLTVDISDDATVGAAALNVTAANTEAAGYLTVYPCTDGVPYASNVNYEADRAGSPNAVVTDLDDAGQVCITSSTPVDVIVDLAGVFTTDTSFVGIVPGRVADTRDGTGGVASTRLTPGVVLEVAVAGELGVPESGVDAASLNVTATEATAPGYLTVYPCTQSTPYASNVNYTDDELSSPNAVLVGLSSAGTVCITSYAPVHVVVDVTGYFTG